MEDNYDLNELRKKPKRKNSRTKGNTFERQIAKLLNDRFKTTEFSRSPGSGAFASTHTVPDHLKIYGDLITPNKFRFCIECKKGYKHLNLYSLYNHSSDLWKFIEQSEKDSGKCSRIPLVIFKQDRQPALAIIPQSVAVTEDIKYIEIHNGKHYRVYLFEELLKCWDSMWFDL
jgi:Holliday junction resolvase